MTTYYNTTNATGQTLKEYIEKAGNQEEEILSVYRRYALPMPANVVRSALKRAGKDYPVSSITRGIRNLTKAGKLIKLNQKVTGPYGRAVHVWKEAGRVYPTEPLTERPPQNKPKPTTNELEQMSLF